MNKLTVIGASVLCLGSGLAYAAATQIVCAQSVSGTAACIPGGINSGGNGCNPPSATNQICVAGSGAYNCTLTTTNCSFDAVVWNPVTNKCDDTGHPPTPPVTVTNAAITGPCTATPIGPGPG